MEEYILSKYKIYCNDNGIIMQQPSSIEIKRKHAYLMYGRRIIVKYNTETGEFFGQRKRMPIF